MKTKLLLAALLMPCLLMAQGGKFSIEGKTGKKAPLKVYLIDKSNGRVLADSSTVKNGTFSFQGEVKEMLTCFLIFDYNNQGPPMRSQSSHHDQLKIILGGESFKVTTADSIKNGKITGSVLNDDFKALNDLMAPVNAKIRVVTKAFKALPTNEQTSQRVAVMKKEIALFDPEVEALSKKFIAGHLKSPISLMALGNMMQNDWDGKAVLATFNTLDASVRESQKGKKILQKINAQIYTVIGAQAPEFTQNDVNDKPVSLSDFRGKYVLIDFWASWCAPCRAENPHVVAAYNQFKDKNFTILGVSLDNPGKKDAWLAAIEKDGLPWTQVSDLKGRDNAVAALYDVRNIPANFLIDPQGRIVAKDLRGDALAAKLAELLK